MKTIPKTDLRAYFFNMAHTPFLILDTNLRIRDINQSARTYIDQDRESLVGTHITEILPELKKSRLFEKYKEVQQSGQPVSLDGIVMNIGSKQYVFSVKVFKVDEGIGIAALDSTRISRTIDALEYARYELKIANDDLRDRNEELEELSYVAAHDLKAPLTNMMTLLEMFPETTEDDPIIAELHPKLMTVGTLMLDRLKVLNQVIALKSALGENKRILEFEKVVNQVLAGIPEEVAAAGVEVVTDFEACPKIYIDPIQLESILHNLIHNAIKYRHPDRTPEIRITTTPKDKKTWIHLADNGLGFEPGEEGPERIFGLFKRQHTHVPGRGVGLYLVKNIIASLGGTITVKTQPMKGTQFDLVL